MPTCIGALSINSYKVFAYNGQHRLRLGSPALFYAKVLSARQDMERTMGILKKENLPAYTYEDLVAKIYQHKEGKLLRVAECDTEIFEFNDATCPFSVDFSVIFKHFRK